MNETHQSDSVRREALVRGEENAGIQPDGAPPDGERRRFRTLFISDAHLGMRGCKADSLAEFLRWHEASTIYLVGDIVDGWRLRKSWYWPASHNDVVQNLFGKARSGTRMFYLPGNHDEFLRDYYGTHFGGIEVTETVIHTAADGRRYLVIHGDVFDVVVSNARWLALFGHGAYRLAMQANTVVNVVRRRLGLTYWSLSQWAKQKVKNAVNGDFEAALTQEARERGLDGVICGHIHKAVIHDHRGIRYVNCGDWVESCTAVAEHDDGRFEIITWHMDRATRTGDASASAASGDASDRAAA